MCLEKNKWSNPDPIFSSTYSGNGIQNHDPTEDVAPPVKLQSFYVPTHISVASVWHKLILIVYQVEKKHWGLSCCI